MKLLFLLALGVLVWAYWSGRLTGFLNGPSKNRMNEQQARALLDVERDSSREDILKAHKGMIAKHHPDRGGNAEIARQVNEARDLLLASIPQKDIT